MQYQTQIKEMAERAKKASSALAQAKTAKKNQLLLAMAQAIEEAQAPILQANVQDLAQATKANVSKPLLERLKLTPERLLDMAQGIRAVAALSDPVGQILEERVLANGLKLQKIRVPIGVIAVIFESRPNVVSDVAALCLKSGNVAILRGGKEALLTNQAVMQAMAKALAAQGFDPYTLQLLPMTDREAIQTLVTQNGLIDLVIPRGGEGLIHTVQSLSSIPVIKHDKGVCHIYVEKTADQDMALAICRDAKCDRPSVCNACECILVHTDIAQAFVPRLAALLLNEGVEIRGDAQACALSKAIQEASADDWGREFLDLIVALKIVSSTKEAIDYINTFGSHHSDSIVSNDKEAQNDFTSAVDSAAVYVNASTRFTDGGCFGLGAEIGISTNKLHCRGPMGLSELTSYKYICQGEGQVRGKAWTAPR